MIFYFDAGGNISGAVKERIYQGTTDFNGIYFIAPFSTKSLIKVRFCLPDASVTSDYELDLCLDGEKNNLYSENSEKCNIWKAKIPYVATKLCGQVYLQFFVLQPTGQTISTASVGFYVEKGLRPLEREEVLSHAEILEKVLALSYSNENLEHAVRCAISETKMEETFIDGVFASAYSVTYGASVKPFIKGKGIKNIAYLNGVFAFGSMAEKGVYYGYLPNKTYKTATLNYGNYEVYALVSGENERFLALGDGAYFSEDGKSYYKVTIDGEQAEGNFNMPPLLAFNLIVMAGIDNKGVYYSENGRDFFTAISTEQSINEIFISNQALFVTTSGDNGGVFVSFDGKNFTKKIESGNFTSHVSGYVTALYGKNTSVHTLDGECFVIADFNENVKLSTYFNGGITAFSSTCGDVFRYEEGGSYSLTYTLDGVVKSVAFGNGKLVAVTDLGSVYLSDDGGEFLKTENIFADLIDFKFVINKFVALTKTVVYYSENGLDFAVFGINGDFNNLQFIAERLFLVGNSGVYELNFTIREKKNFKISKGGEPNSLVLRDEDGNILGVQHKLIEGENIKIDGNVISAKLDVENLEVNVDSVLSLDSDNPIMNKVVTSALNEKGKTTITVSGEEVSTFDADSKLDKKDPAFTNVTSPTALIYGVVNPGVVVAGTHNPTLIDQMIPVSLDGSAKTIVMRDNASRIRQANAFNQSARGGGTGYSVTDKDFNALVRESVVLTGESGTLSSLNFNALNYSPVLTVLLDNEIYHKTGSIGGTLTYQRVNENEEKTIIINNDYTWSLTTVDKTLYSHNVYITFTTDVGGKGNVLLNIISRDKDAYTTTTLLQYILNEDLLNADIQASGRYILSSGEGGAVTSFYSVDGTTMSISTIFSGGMVSANVSATSITDKIVKLN